MLALGLAFGAVLGAPSAAHAAACCGSSQGVGDRLAEGERAAASVGMRLLEGYATYHADGALVAHQDGQVERELRWDVAFATRVGPRLTLAADVPLVYAYRRVDDALSASAVGLGDVASSGRFTLPTPFEQTLATTLTFAVTLPTGRSVRRATEPLQVDATGLGAGELRPGLVLEKTWPNRFFAMLGGSVGFRTHYTENDGSEVELAPRYQLVAAAGPVRDGWSLHGGVVLEAEPAPTVAGRVADGADRRRTALLLFGGYELGRDLTGVVSLTWDPPLSDLGKNERAVFTAALALRHVWSL